MPSNVFLPSAAHAIRFLAAPWPPAELTTEVAPPKTSLEEVSSIYLLNVKTLLQKQSLQPPEGLQLMLEGERKLLF